MVGNVIILDLQVVRLVLQLQKWWMEFHIVLTIKPYHEKMEQLKPTKFRIQA
jgi:hypothetical protein